MSVADIAAASREMLLLTLLLVTPFLAAAMLTSFVVGVLMASTRINDLTLSFVPRLAAVLLVVYLAETWVIAHLAGYLERSIALTRIFHG